MKKRNRSVRRAGLRMATVALLSVVCFPAWVSGQQLASASTDQAWVRTMDLVRQGQFDQASSLVETLPHGALTDKVRTWLTDFEQEQHQRRDLNRQDFEMYVRYAKQRHERKEYTLALEKAVRAADNAEDRDLFLREAWMKQLVDDALASGAELRDQGEWEQAWEVYYYLGLLYENNEQYKKLERTCINHLRLERIFEKDDSWHEPLRNIRMDMAVRVLDYLNRFYVDKDLDFKKLTASALEQLLLLSDSASAQKAFKGLGDENLRAQFRGRIEERLDQVRRASSFNWQAARDHFKRALYINDATVELPDELIISEMVRGASVALDDFTSVIWPTEWAEFQKGTRGEFIGVGISIVKNRKGEVEVVSPLEDAPAYRAGVQAGDLIIAVDGEPLDDISLNKVVETITGPKGTDVTLTMRRGKKEFDLKLTRQRVTIQTVKGVERDADHPEDWGYWLDRDDGIGYVRVTSFSSNTVDRLDEVISQLESSDLRGLVLDLRGNPGGLLTAAEEMASLFLPKGAPVHRIDGRIPQDNKRFDVPRSGPYRDLPLVVLVDEGSASASEIVSGALRDDHRAIVVGARTYGKFSVQNLIPISNVPPAALKITTARYFIPSGVSLHREPGAKTWGVEPNIPVRLVNKEKIKLYQMRRKRDVLGPAAPTEGDVDKADKAGEADKADDTVKPDDSAKPDSDKTQPDEADGKAPTDQDNAAGETSGEADAEDTSKDGQNPKLPPLEQPDENKRPEVDPQLDAALLVLRVQLLGERYPTLATANTKTPAPGEEKAKSGG